MSDTHVCHSLVERLSPALLRAIALAGCGVFWSGVAYALIF